jgi:hypothetical protein
MSASPKLPGVAPATCSKALGVAPATCSNRVSTSSAVQLKVVNTAAAMGGGQRRGARRTTSAMCGVPGGGSIRGSTAYSSTVKSSPSSRPRSSAPT